MYKHPHSGTQGSVIKVQILLAEKRNEALSFHYVSATKPDFFNQNIEHFSYFIALKAASPENLISGYGYSVGHASSCSLKKTEEIG